MDALTCPRCDAEMVTRSHGVAEVLLCPAGHGVFLERAELGSLIEAESDWHDRSVQDTAQLPRITGDDVPPMPGARSRAFVETLFD
jgi:Zn-finger nucleic acid-binding protein